MSKAEKERLLDENMKEMKVRNALIEQRKRELDQYRKIAESNKSSINIAPNPIENIRVEPKSAARCQKLGAKSRKSSITVDPKQKCENEPISHQKLDPKMRTELSKAEKERLLDEKIKFQVMKLRNALIEQRKLEFDRNRKIAQSTKSSITVAPKPKYENEPFTPPDRMARPSCKPRHQSYDSNFGSPPHASGAPR